MDSRKTANRCMVFGPNSRLFAALPGHTRVALAILAAGLAMMPPATMAADKPNEKASEQSGTAATAGWPAAVHAHYRLRYNGINVGNLHIVSTATAKTYAMSGMGKVSVLMGAITWSGSSNVSGAIDSGAPSPASYSFNWKNNRKGGTIDMGFKNRSAAEIAVIPPPDPHPDLVPLTPAHKTGVLDPVSALLMLTKTDGRPPCDRRVGIFDGKQRYDIVMTYKRDGVLPRASGKGPAEPAIVCRAMYEPVAGHRANEATKTYASNRDVEVMLRRIPGSDNMFIPHSVTVPTAWGTGSMVVERIEITTAGAGKIALTE